MSNTYSLVESVNRDNSDAFIETSQRDLAAKDLTEGFKKWRIWTTLAYQDIKMRYRRSILGPFWITLSMAITVYTMGYLYGHLFHTDLNIYFPFIVTGMLTWSIISTLITDSVDIFASAESMIKQIKLPYTLYINRAITRNFIIFFHNVVVLIPIYIFFHDSIKFNYNTLLIIPCLLLLYINGFSFGLILAIVGGRYRDLAQMVKNLVQIVFFVTPVMWSASILPPSKMYVALFNPFYSFVQILREPLLGKAPDLINYLIVILTTLFGLILAFGVFKRYRARIVYWL